MLGVRTFFQLSTSFFASQTFCIVGSVAAIFTSASVYLNAMKSKSYTILGKTILFSGKPTHALLIMRLIPEQKSPQALQSQ